VFLTRSPLRCPKAPPFDLHALGTPPAFILSQDQTLSPIFLLPLIRGLKSWFFVRTGAHYLPCLQEKHILRVAHPSPAPLCCQSALPASPDGKSDSTPALCRCQGLYTGNFAYLSHSPHTAPIAYSCRVSLDRSPCSWNNTRRASRMCRRSSAAEQGTHKPLVAGSIPAVGTIPLPLPSKVCTVSMFRNTHRWMLPLWQ